MMKPLKHALVGIYSAEVWVITKHGSMLEFVLDEAYERRPAASPIKSPYDDLLWDMLHKEFEKSRGIEVKAMNCYGDIQFRVEAENPKQLENAIARFDKVVGRWINKYRINHMKES